LLAVCALSEPLSSDWTDTRTTGRYGESPYVLPEICTTCSKDVEHVLQNCRGLYELPIECVGALVYAARDCLACLCEVVSAGLEPGLSEFLCPVCPQLDVCQE